MLASTSEIDLKTALCLQIVGIERNLVLLLFGAGLYEQRVTKIVIVQMKGDFIIPVAVGPYRLADCHPRVFDQYLKLSARLPLLVAHKPFNGKPVIGFMCGKEDGRKRQTDHAQDRKDPPAGAAADILPASKFPQRTFCPAFCSRPIAV